MKLVSQFEISCPLSALHENDPYLIGFESLQPLIVSNRYSPQILTFENGEWRELTSFPEKSANHFYGVSVSPYGIVVSQFIESGEKIRTEQHTFLDFKTTAPVLSQNKKGFWLEQWLSNQTFIGIDERTNKYVCATLDGTILWRADIPDSENLQVHVDKDYIYFWDHGVVTVLDGLGHTVGKYPSPQDIMNPRFYSANLHFEGKSLYIEGLNEDANKYMLWKCTETEATPVPQTLFDLSATPNIYRFEQRNDKILLLSGQRKGNTVGTQCCLLCRKTLTGPVPLFFVPEREPQGGEIFWIDDSKFIYIQPESHSQFDIFDIYTIDGKKACEGRSLPGLLWGNIFYASGLLYIPSRKFISETLEMKYYFNVFEL